MILVGLRSWLTAWKETKVVPILKSGSNPSLRGSYRPISLLSTFGKLFESFILDRIRRIVDDRALLRDCKFAFRDELSTVHAPTSFYALLPLNLISPRRLTRFGIRTLYTNSNHLDMMHRHVG